MAAQGEEKYDLEIVDGAITHATGVREGAKMEATLGNVIDAMRQRYPDANIVTAPGLARLRVSDLKLRTKRIWEELEAIRVASGGRFVWSGPGSPAFGAPGAPDVGRFLAEASSDQARQIKDAGLFTLHEFVTPDRERTIEAFNIGPYLQHGGDDQETSAKPEPGYKPNQETRDKRLAEVEKIINQTVAALHDRGVEGPEYQFHNGANLLIVIGSQEAVGVARKIISALPGQGGMPFVQNIPAMNPAGLRTIPERTVRYPGVSPNPPLPSRQPSPGLLQPMVVPGPVPQPGQ
jgi:hypothetical protein